MRRVTVNDSVVVSPEAEARSGKPVVFVSLASCSVATDEGIFSFFFSFSVCLSFFFLLLSLFLSHALPHTQRESPHFGADVLLCRLGRACKVGNPGKC